MLGTALLAIKRCAGGEDNCCTRRAAEGMSQAHAVLQGMWLPVVLRALDRLQARNKSEDGPAANPKVVSELPRAPRHWRVFWHKA
jgi:hypothetical protein